MEPWADMTGNPVWRDKAVAFAARSRQELWGKHNEDILAWFFVNGFKNRFIKDMFLGWNRRPKERPAENWGFTEPDAGCAHLFFPPGIVIPWVVDQHLLKLMIVDHTKTAFHPCHVAPGSARIPVVFGGGTRRTAVVENILHGLLLHQEFPENLTVVIPDDPDQPLPVAGTAHAEGPVETLYFPDPLNEKRPRPACEIRSYTQTPELMDFVRQWMI